jgi:hypothetical protein
LKQRAKSTSLFITVRSSGTISNDLAALEDGILSEGEVAFLVFSLTFIKTGTAIGINSNISVNNVENLRARENFYTGSSSGSLKSFAPAYWDPTAHVKLFSGASSLSTPNAKAWQV